MKQASIILILFLLSLFASGCVVDFGQEPPDLKSLNGKVHILISEKHPSEDQDPIIAISMVSEHIFECINYRIVYTLSKNGNTLNLHIEGVTIGPICATALGPATATHFLNLPVGTYTLRVHLDGYIDTYTVHIANDAIQLIPSEPFVSKPLELLVWRYPKPSFAFYAGTLIGDEWLVNAFVDTLRKHLPLQELNVPRSGRWPYARSIGGYHSNAQPRYFRYQHEAQFDSAGSLLKAFSIRFLNNRSGAGFWIENWRAKTYMSWYWR